MRARRILGYLDIGGARPRSWRPAVDRADRSLRVG